MSAGVARLGVGAIGLLGRLPLPMLRGLAAATGHLLFYLARSRRHVVEVNLALCFPHWSATQRHAVARQTFVHVAQSLLDRAWLWHAPRATVLRRLRLHGALHTLEGDAPTILFAPHFCGMDAAAIALSIAALHRPCASIYTRQSSAVVNEWMDAGRKRFHPGLRTFDRVASIKPIASELRKGGLLYLLPDMDFGPEQSVFVPFYGVATATVPSLSRFARLARARVVPVLAKLTSAGYDIELLPPWQDFPTDDMAADTALMNERLARWIDAMPSQYYWVHRRFKTRPEGEAGVY